MHWWGSSTCNRFVCFKSTVLFRIWLQQQFSLEKRKGEWVAKVKWWMGNTSARNSGWCNGKRLSQELGMGSNFVFASLSENTTCNTITVNIIFKGTKLIAITCHHLEITSLLLNIKTWKGHYPKTVITYNLTLFMVLCFHSSHLTDTQVKSPDVVEYYFP